MNAQKMNETGRRALAYCPAAPLANSWSSFSLFMIYDEVNRTAGRSWMELLK